jgi:hypothetical protein
MRYMMMIKANADYEAGRPPNQALMTAMGALTEEMMRSGIVESTGGLLPSAAGTRLAYTKGRRTVVDGPFAETKELIGGFAIVNASSREHAVALASRVLDIHVEAGVADFEMEIRPMFDPENAPCSQHSTTVSA